MRVLSRLSVTALQSSQLSVKLSNKNISKIINGVCLYYFYLFFRFPRFIKIKLPVISYTFGLYSLIPIRCFNLKSAMGRKSQSKQAPKKNSGKENNRFVQQKRMELAVLVDKVLKCTSVFQASTSVKKNWEQHLEIDTLMKEISNLESPRLKNFPKHRKSSIENYLKWLNENGVQYDGTV